MEQMQKLGQYSETTRDIKVTVNPEYVEERSSPEEDSYVYAYTVTLENVGTETVQLINRHWIVLSGKRQIGDVKGEGVVGEQPMLEPGVAFQYTSWTVVDSPVGSMHGTYTFRSESNVYFDVTIPKFDLIYIDQATFH